SCPTRSIGWCVHEPASGAPDRRAPGARRSQATWRAGATRAGGATMRYAMFFLVLACGSATPSPAKAPLIEEPARAPSPPPPPPPRPARAELTRTALNAALDAGPGAFLAKVRVVAARSAGRFLGWEIEALWPGAAVGLERGDIVTAVNGRTLERPEALP